MTLFLLLVQDQLSVPSRTGLASNYPQDFHLVPALPLVQTQGRGGMHELQNSTASSAVPPWVTALVPAAGGAHMDVTTCRNTGGG